MGDNWVHTVCLEQSLELERAPKVARCVEGARARPPEDVGGPGGYQEFLEAVLDRSHEEHRAMLRWAGGHFDPEWFDLELTNKDVERALRANLKRRARQPRKGNGELGCASAFGSLLPFLENPAFAVWCQDDPKFRLGASPALVLLGSTTRRFPQTSRPASFSSK
jgi:hypothetical protein